MAAVEKEMNEIEKIKNNINKLYFNKSNKLNDDCKDELIEIILDNKNITPKPIYFNFQETETEKKFDKIDHLLKYFEEQKAKEGKEKEKKKLNKTENEEEWKEQDIVKENKITEVKEDLLNRTKINEFLKLEEIEKEVLACKDTDIDIDKQYELLELTETETIYLLKQPNLLYENVEENKKIQKTNELYENLLNSSENNCRNKSMQTLNIFTKNKDVYVSTINKQHKQSQTNLFHLYKLSLRNTFNMSELLHRKFLKHRNKKLKKILNEFGDSLNINEKVILNKNMWIQVVDKNVTDTKHTTIIPKSFYKSKKNNTNLFSNLFATKNLTRTVSNKSRTFRTKSRFKNIKTMKFLASSFSEDEYLIKSIIKRKKEESDEVEKKENAIDDASNKILWTINNKKKNIQKDSFVNLMKNMEKFVVQNNYFYKQMIYKNIDLSFLKEYEECKVEDQIRMFDGENYDPLNNSNINYKKKKTTLQMKINRNLKEAIKFKPKEYKKKSGKDEIEPSTNDSNKEQKIIRNIKRRLTRLSKKKKKQLNKEIDIQNVKKKIRAKVKKNRCTEKDTKREDEYCKEEGTKEEKEKKKKKEVKSEKESEQEENTIDKIGDILMNEEQEQIKIKKINTILLDDVLKKKDTTDTQIINTSKSEERKKIKNKIHRKKKFVIVQGNNIKLKKKEKEEAIYKHETGNELYKKDIENNLLQASKRKKYIKNISITKLFQFRYNKLENIVTSIDTNNYYMDYITASYASTLDIGSFQNSKGNVAIFNFINPSYPLKMYTINSCVMKIKYSDFNPNLIIATLSNGHLNIYDIRNNDSNPVLKSTTIKNYYENSFEPIYDMAFRNISSSKKNLEEVFYTVHESGFIYEWQLDKELKNKEILFLQNKKNDLYQDFCSVFQKKNFLDKSFNSSLTCIDIDDFAHHDEDFIINNIEKDESYMSDDLPQTTTPNKNEMKKRELNQTRIHEEESNFANGSIQNNKEKEEEDVEGTTYNRTNSKEKELLNHYKNVTKNIIDKKIKPAHSYYYVGTKNGIIYRCNSCYQKSYLNYYVAHFGSVSKIKINPFDHDIFLSSGEDGTIKLWNKYSNTQITTFKSKNSYTPVNDILWLPNNATSFFSCSDDGRIELWDFDFFSKDPLIIFYPNNLEYAKIKSLKIFHQNNILLSGDNCGNVFMMKINNLFNLPLDENEQKMKLTSCLKYLDTYDYF